MTSKLKQRKKNPTHEQMLVKGYALEPPKKKQKKGEITSIQWGSNGRQYWKLMKMTKSEINSNKSYKKLVKAGKQVWFTYKPNGLIMDFIFKYHLDVKKDKLGNVTVTVSRMKKAKRKVNKTKLRRRRRNDY